MILWIAQQKVLHVNKKQSIKIVIDIIVEKVIDTLPNINVFNSPRRIQLQGFDNP